MRRFVLLIALLAPLGSQAGMDEGVAAYNRGDYAAAAAEFEPLAKQGDAEAQYIMGTLYHYGYGEPRDDAKAAEWFRRAADQGHAQSQYYLGLMYQEGEGLPKDLVASHMWYSISAATTKNYRDSLYAKAAAQKLEKRMSDAEVSKAKQMAAAWSPK